MTDKKQNQRADFYRRLDEQHMFPLWQQMHSLVPAQPADACVPAIWRYSQVRDYLAEAGEIISSEEAVRRVLILENPGLSGQSSITSSLYAGLQMLLPGETAPSHRHSQSALRFVMEGSGAFTVVDGERTTMHPGDFIITPSWAWHDHGNPEAEQGGEKVVWLDGLDIPIVRFFNAGFAEVHEELVQPIQRAEGTSPARFGHNLMPVRHEVNGRTSPIFNYPYARSRETLDILLRQQALDPYEGIKLSYRNPLTGGWAMPTIATFIQLLPAGFNGLPSRSTDATVYSVVEGEGVVRIGERQFSFSPRDIFVVPSWAAVSFSVSSETVLFSFSDRPVQEALGLLREAR
ncbi:gentisate 1,2-dioxygenase [Pseudomonas sp. 5P_3.1_Bac2]|uniref:gentisate 1,2-dioxygenase n=1 Tax=Pseudomonas sp. 5P_3.1_Bac2 TaxID=2971617 RepID=UPI0021C7308D|nr:gentisate 1,2-dioxygenase [Pseudomonas sp. 5P_3.1_Bac2]MCU1719649.1 gentisate 1,2-dioxygenase [Pseudomonas sp. 5P_3.1_Bac2]